MNSTDLRATNAPASAIGVTAMPVCWNNVAASVPSATFRTDAAASSW